MAQSLSPDVLKQLRLVADGLDQAARALRALLPSEDKPARRATRSRRAQPAPVEPQVSTWEDVLLVAIQLVADEHDDWSAAELVDALQKSGVHLPSWRGVPNRLVSQLVAEGAIVRVTESRKGARYRRVDRHAAPTVKAVKAKAGRPARKPAKAKPAAAPVARDWPGIVQAVAALLREDPARRWRPIDLVQAVHQRGMELGSRRGLHFALPTQLVAAGVGQIHGDGTVGVAGEPLPAVAAVPPVVRRRATEKVD